MPNAESFCRILSLDGGGAKGFYTLGVLREIEAMVDCPLCQRFELIFGTSTGAIIATLIALGYKVDEIHSIYKEHVPTVMGCRTRAARTKALAHLTKVVYGDKTFADVKTGVGVVTAKWMTERPMIFKGSVQQAHGSRGTFVPGFGVSIADAVQASCSAFPFFLRKVVVTAAGDKIELIDGGYCANNPTLYAIADALVALKRNREDLRVISIGVGVWLFAGSDDGGERAAAIYTLLGTAKLNDLNPESYLRYVLERIADHPINQIEELLPWNLLVKMPELRIAA
jgi:uncharacterized protein